MHPSFVGRVDKPFASRFFLFMKKTCKKCGTEKPTEDFLYHRTTVDNLSGSCRKCDHLRRMNYLRKKRENSDLHEIEKSKTRKKYRDLKYNKLYKHTKDCRNKSTEKYNKKFPEKYKARYLSRYLKRTPGKQHHHWNYSAGFAKDVILIDNVSHKKLHRFLEYDQSTFMYKRIDTGELLDTRKKHEAYMFDVLANKPD